MTREDTPKDMDAYQQTLDDETRQGRRPADRRGPRALGGRRAPTARRTPTRSTSRPAPQPAAAAGGGRRRPQPRRPRRPPARPRPAAVAAGCDHRRPRPCGRRRCRPGNVPTPKKGADDKHRLLALVPPEGIQRVEREQGDRVNVWPHLLIEEFVAMLILLAGMLVFSTFVNAPLRELANPNLTPNPSKAPWYFLGLQELLRYFHPMVAGIVIPTFILVGLAAVPYVDRNPSTKPGDRKIAITMFTMLFMFGATLTIIGSLLPRPGLQLDLAVGARGVLRAMTARPVHRPRRGDRRLRRRSTSSPSCSACRSCGRARAQQSGRGRRARRRRSPRVHVASRLLPQVAVTSLLVFGAQFGGAIVAFLWPNLKGGFGSVINAGQLEDIKAQIDEAGSPVYYGAGRFYIVPWTGKPNDGRRLPARGLTTDGHHAAVPAVRAPGLPRAVLRLVEVVRVPLPRLEVQRRGRVPAGPGPPRDGPLPRDDRRTAT